MLAYRYEALFEIDAQLLCLAVCRAKTWATETAISSFKVSFVNTAAIFLPPLFAAKANPLGRDGSQGEDAGVAGGEADITSV